MKKWISLAILVMFSSLAQAQSGGILQVMGKAGKFQMFQKVKAVRCQTDQRGACDDALFLDLNKDQEVPAGSYLIGFENSINPEVVEVASGQRVVLNLTTIKVPSKIRGGKIRIYRDFSSSTEQQKILMTMYMMNRHFFRLDAENFGDLYLAGSWERDFVQRFTYEICPKIKLYGNVAEGAEKLCKTWNEASNPKDLKDFFKFGNDGTFEELWVTHPGDVVPSKHTRYLVSAPLSTQDTVAVFPGVYRVQAEGKNSQAVSVTVENNN